MHFERRKTRRRRTDKKQKIQSEIDVYRLHKAGKTCLRISRSRQRYYLHCYVRAGRECQ